MGINNSINSGQTLSASSVPTFSGLNLSSTSHALSLNTMSTAQFTSQSPAQGAMAYTVTSETIIFFDGMLNQLVASQIWVNSNFAPSIAYSEITGTSVSMAINSEYTANNVALVTLTLPVTAAVGSVEIVNGKGAGGWKIAQNASQQIVGMNSSTVGTGGSLASSEQYDCVVLKCITANTTWVVQSMSGNLNWT